MGTYVIYYQKKKIFKIFCKGHVIYNLISTLLNLLTRSSNYPSQLHSFNTWFFLNSHIFYYKLSNHLTFFTYVHESLKLNVIRVYGKSVNILNIVSFCAKFGFLLIGFLMF